MANDIYTSIYEEKLYKNRKGEVLDLRLFGAFPDKGQLQLNLRCHRAVGVTSAKLVIHSDGVNEGEKYFTYTLEKTADCDLAKGITDEVYTVVLPLRELSKEGSLFYYYYDITCFEGRIHFGGERPTVLERRERTGERQLLIYREGFDTPNFLKGGNVYHIFVDRFAPSGRCVAKEGTFINPKWEGAIPMYPEYRGAPLKNNEFFGGDLWGIIEKLDYLQDLGVTTLYLSPVFEAASNHKYDTSDYMNVDSMFGGNKALEALCKECKRRNIEIFLDGVFNHTGDDSIYFDRYHKYGNGACTSKESPYYKWYEFKSYPDKYVCWWDIDILPRVKSEDSGYQNFIFGKNGVVDRWIDCGVAGFRLDVADELCDSFLDGFVKRVKEKRSDAVVIGEVWEDASNKIAYGRRRHYFNGCQLDSVMNYPLREGVISFIKYGDYKKLRDITEGIYRRYPKCVSDVLMNFLGTHDTERIITVLAGKSGEGKTTSELAELHLTKEEKKKGRALLKCAYTIIAFMYGFPSVFYGDEAGSEGYHDPFCRRPFPWNNIDPDIHDYFAKVGKTRLKYPLFKDGIFEICLADENCFVFKRYNGKKTAYICVTRDSERRLEFSEKVTNVLSSGTVKSENFCAYTVPAYTAAVFITE